MNESTIVEPIELVEHGPYSKPVELDPKDADWINQQNDEDDAQYRSDLKKLKLKNLGKGKYQIKAKGHVGSISLPSSNLTINIQPKFENAWENLFKLFEETETIDPNYGGNTVQAEEGHNLWDILANNFSKKALHLIKSGLYRRYITKTEEITAIRGRLLVTQNIRSPQKFRVKHWCEFDELSYDVPENQYVLYCTNLLLRFVKSEKIKQDLVRIKNIISSQDVVLQYKFTLADAKSITINRMNQKYQPVFRYCELILNSMAYKKFSDIKGVPIPDFTLSMWDLFEKFVNVVLKKYYKERLIEIDYQKQYKQIVERDPNYKNREQYSNPTKLEPDNVLTSKQDKKLVIDTKWKKKVAPGDWYQAVSYSLALKCDTILLLPRFEKKYSDGFKIPEEYFKEKNLTVHVKTIDFEQASKSTDFIEDLKTQIHEIVDNIDLK